MMEKVENNNWCAGVVCMGVVHGWCAGGGGGGMGE